MRKWMRAIFLSALCAILLCGGNRVYGGEKTSNGVYDRLSENRAMEGKDKDLYFYIDNGTTKEISYISYNVEIRKDADENREGREVTVIRIVRK